MRERWRQDSIKHASADTPSPTRRASMRRHGGYSVRDLRTVNPDQDWAITKVDGWEQHLDNALKESRQDSRAGSARPHRQAA